MIEIVSIFHIHVVVCSDAASGDSSPVCGTQGHLLDTKTD